MASDAAERRGSGRGPVPFTPAEQSSRPDHNVAMVTHLSAVAPRIRDQMSRTAPVVAVVEPETPGNVGTIARAMKNFGFRDLKLIDAPELDPDGEAYGFAGQARKDVLPDHDRPTFDELVEQYHTVG